MLLSLLCISIGEKSDEFARSARKIAFRWLKLLLSVLSASSYVTLQNEISATLVLTFSVRRVVKNVSLTSVNICESEKETEGRGCDGPPQNNGLKTAAQNVWERMGEKNSEKYQWKN